MFLRSGDAGVPACHAAPGAGPGASLSAAALEELDRALVLFGGGPGLERPEVAALAGLRVFLAGVEAVFAGLEFADHMQLGSRRRDAADTAGEDAGATGYNFSTTVPSTKAS